MKSNFIDKLSSRELHQLIDIINNCVNNQEYYKFTLKQLKNKIVNKEIIEDKINKDKEARIKIKLKEKLRQEKKAKLEKSIKIGTNNNSKVLVKNLAFDYRVYSFFKENHVVSVQNLMDLDHSSYCDQERDVKDSIELGKRIYDFDNICLTKHRKK